MTAIEFKKATQVKDVSCIEIPAPVAPVELPEAGKMLNVVLGMLLLILLSSVVMHYL